MIVTPIVFRSGHHADPSEGELVASDIVINAGDVLTPCKPVNVWRYAPGRSRTKKIYSSWGRFTANWPSTLGPTVFIKPKQAPISTKEDDEWVNHSRNTLHGWMAENEE